jgi:long-chain fatty acid transport protein
MKMRPLVLLSILAGSSLWTGTAHANGYSFWEQSAMATGKASAVVATPNEPAAGFFNPAGLADLSGIQISFGGTFVLQTGGYTTTINGVSQEFDRANRGQFPPNLHLYYAQQGKWAVGVSIFNAWGLGIDWPPDFPGGYRIDRVDLKTPTIQPTFAWRPSKQFSLGVGVSISIASAELLRQLPLLPFVPTPTTAAGSVLLGADGAIGIGGNIGFLFTPMDKLRIGLHYRSAMKFSFSGNAHFDFPNTIPAAIRATLPSDQTGSLEITTPHSVSLGLAYDVTPNVTIELDAVQYFWSVFDELRLKFGPPPPGGQPVPGNCTPPGSPQGVSHVCSARNWMDAPQFRLGVEWRATPEFSLRGGYIFDLSPVPSGTLDPILPDSNRHDFSIGVGYKFTKNFRLDFAYLLVYFLPVSGTTKLVPQEASPGTYNTVGHLFALNVGLSF